MKAQELRIGIWVYLFGDAVQLTKDHLIYLLQKDGLPEPISLTPEWLKKFGFKREDSLFNLWIKDDISLLEKGLTEQKFYDFLFNDDHKNGTADAVSLRWVHQLQNLYLALTVEEL